jgi:hypothetical protein
MRRLFTLTFAVLLLFGSVTAASADDGSGCARPQPYIESDYGDVNVR